MTVDDFTTLSAALTGFDTDELRATGLAEEYHALVLREAGEPVLGRLRAAVAADGGPPGPADDPARELARALVQLWYLGSWPGLAVGADAFVVSARAYGAGLVWRTFGARAPGTAAREHGSWGAAPVLPGLPAAAPTVPPVAPKPVVLPAARPEAAR